MKRRGAFWIVLVVLSVLLALTIFTIRALLFPSASREALDLKDDFLEQIFSDHRVEEVEADRGNNVCEKINLTDWTELLIFKCWDKLMEAIKGMDIQKVPQWLCIYLLLDEKPAKPKNLAIIKAFLNRLEGSDESGTDDCPRIMMRYEAKTKAIALTVERGGQWTALGSSFQVSNSFVDLLHWKSKAIDTVVLGQRLMSNKSNEADWKMVVCIWWALCKSRNLCDRSNFSSDIVGVFDELDTMLGAIK